MQFIRWVAPSCVCTDAVLGSIISKLQCSVFDVKRAMNKVPTYVIALVLYSKWSLGIVIYFFCMVLLGKGNSAKASSHYFALFRSLQN